MPWVDAPLDAVGLASVSARFHDMHEQRFSYANRTDVVELVTLRLAAAGRLARPRLAEPEQPSAGSAAGCRLVYIDGGWHEIAVWRRSHIGAAAVIEGPAIIEEDYTTIFLAPRWTLRRAVGGHLVADQREAHA